MTSLSSAELQKRIAAKKAASYVKDGMLLGLGSGSTFEYTLQEVARKIKEEGIKVQGVASSERTAALATELGVPVVDFPPHTAIDLTIDGADEVDGTGAMIKGGGAALLREKVNAYFSKHVVIAVDESKPVDCLGRFPLPVEVLPFAANPVKNRIENVFGIEARLRRIDGEPLITDNGHYILDCAFTAIADVKRTDDKLKSIPGVVETGLFIGLLHTLIVGRSDGTAHVTTFSPSR